MRSLFKKFLRIIQKVPGINLVEYVTAGPVCYVVNPKAASRSLAYTLIKWKTGVSRYDDEFYWSQSRISTLSGFKRKSKGLEIFTVTRDDEDRLFSCWKDKIAEPDSRGRLFQQYFLFYWPYIRFGMDYDTFRRRVQRIPAPMCEKHFMPQKCWLRLDSISYAAVFELTELEACEKWLSQRLRGARLDRALNQQNLHPEE